MFLRLVIGTVRTHRLIHRADLQNGYLTSPLCASPVTVGLVKPIVILPEYWPEWPKPQLEAVLAHEHEHVRRRDPLVQWFASLNRAVFWFHPLAWWLERRLSALAEENCDAVVLASGHDPQAYSEYLLDIARSVMNAGRRMKAAGMAMPGRSLSRRIRNIFNGVSVPPASRTRLACTLAVVTVLSALLAVGTLEHAQALASEQAGLQSAPSKIPLETNLSDSAVKPTLPKAPEQPVSIQTDRSASSPDESAADAKRSLLNSVRCAAIHKEASRHSIPPRPRLSKEGGQFLYGASTPPSKGRGLGGSTSMVPDWDTTA